MDLPLQNIRPTPSSPTLSHRSLSSLNLSQDMASGVGTGTSSSAHHNHNHHHYPAALHSVHAAQTSSSALRLNSSSSHPHSNQHHNHPHHHTLSIDTNAASLSNLPSPTPSPDFYESHDPMSLASKRMSEEQIVAIKSNKKVREFYREQNELISDLLDPPEGREGAAELEERNQVKLKIAIYGSMGVNVLLFLLQLYAAISSKSLSLFATMADSFMDLLSGFILMYAARASTKSNWFKYPSGKSRMETAGTIVFASLMATVSLQLIIESIRTLLDADKVPPMPGTLAIAFVGFALASKLCLFLYCRAIAQYNTANILAHDHRNDLIVNGFGLFASLVSRYCWWLDAAGAIVVALIILRSWVWTAYEQIQLIVGKTADPAFLKKLTYIALTHHRKILQVDTCTAYHAGNNLFVEVDVVMSPDTPLMVSHDISESLQIKLEALPNVERAFVHVDYETSHAPEHRKSK
ncbi:cation efflux family protein [Linnemannia elongata]|nr:cation efflux family protein [Linnemannia elongata]